MTVKILDLRHEQTNPFPGKRASDGTSIATSKVIKGKTFERDPKTITGITIHQTACVFGPAADLDKRNRRALGVPAHAVAFRDGTVVLPAPLSWYLYHGNDFNQFSLGLECEGQYPGLLDDPRTPKREDEQTIWKGASPTPLDAQAIESFRAALARLVEEGRSLGMPIQYIWAHRQSNGNKPSDPGQEIWQKVVLDYGVKTLGLKTQPSLTMRDGRPIPRAWEPDAQGSY